MIRDGGARVRGAFWRALKQDFRSIFLMTKNKLAAILICSVASAIAQSDASATGDGEWRNFSEEPNGDVHFYDASRVKSISNLHRVWNRIRYKTSVMGASSYQSLLEIDCSERTERILQNTFFTDKHWKKPAMNTDMTEKPKRLIVKDSATERLFEILCDQ